MPKIITHCEAKVMFLLMLVCVSLHALGYGVCVDGGVWTGCVCECVWIRGVCVCVCVCVCVWTGGV